MTFTIRAIQAIEILDSRGRPTIKAFLTLSGGGAGTASIPSGSSTGKAEAHEMRDGDPLRYHGLGCKAAVSRIESEIRSALVGKSFEDQETLDNALIQLDGTPQKTRLGGNSLLSLSLAFARAAANQKKQPLFKYFADLAGIDSPKLPKPTINLFSGGLHAGKQVPVQDCLIIPHEAQRTDDALAITYEVYQSAASLIRKRYNMRLLTADEGGLSPDFESQEAMFDLCTESILKAGFNPGKEISIAIDVAASHFFDSSGYHLDHGAVSSSEMIDLLEKWKNTYPVVSIEDGLAEDDWEFWPLLTERLGNSCLVMGDDFLCTNVERIKRAAHLNAANALLLKVNQVGTLTEACHALQEARKAGWKVTISARSGETEDNWLADMAAGWQGDFIKVGSINQSERLSKYNRLLELEKFYHIPMTQF
jgi:enolase